MTEIGECRAVAPTPRADLRRTRLRLEGLVQGVGFRPCISRLAHRLDLRGWVVNTGDGVTAEIEGRGASVEEFLASLTAELPPLARVDRMGHEEIPPTGDAAFSIRTSEGEDAPTALIMPDVATCDACLNEVFDPSDRRYLYPFTNCTNCGPRFSILEALPYDRPNTTMRHFAMCPACRAEYENPRDRRFHAQPVACQDCGPHLTLLGPAGNELTTRHEALLAAAAALRRGRIVALKGLGGFQLLADARNDGAVTVLRGRKRRPDKPFAVMVPSLDAARAYCRTSALERDLLTSAEAPIALLDKRDGPRDGPRDGWPALSPGIAPANPLLGVMLPYTPLHHLLLRELGFPIVATSGNLSDEPIATDEGEALDRLEGIADLFLVHDRPIARPLDDSVVRTLAGRPLVLRRARGYAPFPIAVKSPAPGLLALGGHLKAAPAVSAGSRIILGAHVGDLDNAPARHAFGSAARDLTGLYAVRPQAVVCDAHPDYHTSQMARRSGARVIAVQHHLAHIAACMAENGIEGGRAMGVAWDGTGYGEDGTVWGGEFMLIDGARARRIGHFLPFTLPGGEKAVKEPRRAALGLLHQVLGEAALADESLAPVRSFSPTERRILARMLSKGLNAPRTSSAGRLFDAVASLLGLAHQTSFEGQAAMALEFEAGGVKAAPRYGFDIECPPRAERETHVLDWRPMVRALLEDIGRGIPAPQIAAAFHETLIDAILAMARRAGEQHVVLTGGCFQNRRLMEGAVDRLRDAGFDPVWHRHVPPNDGGLALGQAVWAAQTLERGEA